MNPLDVLCEAMTTSFLSHHYGKRGKFSNVPGAVISHMSQERREILSRLTSDMTVNMRADWVDGDEAWRQDQAFRRLKLDFDAKCKRPFP